MMQIDRLDHALRIGSRSGFTGAYKEMRAKHKLEWEDVRRPSGQECMVRIVMMMSG